MSRLIWPFYGQAPSAGDKLYTYKTGTTTDLATYSDSGLTTANANPVVANGDGEFGDIFLLPGQAYKLVWKTSADVSIDDADPVYAQKLTGNEYVFETLSELRSYWPSTATLENKTPVRTRARSTYGDNGGGSYYYDSSDTSTAENGVWCIVDDEGRRFKLSSDITLELAGISLAAADNSTAFATLKSAVEALDRFVVVKTTSRSDLTTTAFNFTSGITIDVNRMALDLGGNTLKFSTGASTAVTLTSSNTFSSSPYENARTGIMNGTIFGPSSGTNVGLKFDNTVASAQFKVEDLGIAGFTNAVELRANNYLITFDHCKFYQNTGIAIKDSAGIANAGENIRFLNCDIFNNTGAAMELVNSSGTYRFVNCSIDYNNSSTNHQILVTDASAEFFGCHIEGNAQRAVRVNSSSSAGRAAFYGCEFIQQQSSSSTAFILAESGGYVSIFGGRINAHSSTAPVVLVNSGGFYASYSVLENYSGSTWITDNGSVVRIRPDGQAQFDSTATTGGLTVGNGVIGSSGGVTCSVTNTWYTVSSTFGLYVFRDATSGNTALFNCDSSGQNSIQNAITGFEVQFASSNIQVRVTSGTAPRTISFAVVGGFA